MASLPKSDKIIPVSKEIALSENGRVLNASGYSSKLYPWQASIPLLPLVDELISFGIYALWWV